LFIALVAGLTMTALLGWFSSLEAKGERHKILIVLVLVAVFEAMLAGRASEVPRGFLRPEIAGQDFRPPDAVIVAALGARVLNLKGERISGLAMFWAAFLAIYITSAAVGILNGFNTVEVLFQAKGAFYLTGAIVIASGADPRKVVDGLGRLAPWAGAATLIFIGLTLAGIRLAFTVPGQRINSFGFLSNDSVTLLTLLGAAVLLTEAIGEKPRALQVGSGLVMILSPVAGTQRASYLVLAVVILFLFGLFLTRGWANRASVTGLEVLLVLAALVGLAGVGFIVGDEEVVAPIEDAFTGEAERRSAESRFSLADQALSRIADRPLLGWGTGVKVIRQAQLSNREVAAAAHNLILDLAMRVGLVGLGVFLAAVSASTLTAGRLWRSTPDDRVAIVAVIGVICMFAVLSKGMVEPALDKFRLSQSLGVSIGLIMAAYNQHASSLGRVVDELDAAPFPGRIQAP
jgi:hypothetical protein